MTPPSLKANFRILIVDDNRAIHEDFRKILSADDGAKFDGMEAALFKSPVAIRKLPYDIDSSYQGQEALTLVGKACAEDRPYALAFVDVRMPPGWDGVETAARIWKVSPDTQIVLCTAYSDYSWDEVLSKLNRSDHLVILNKPFDVVEVLQLAAGLTEQYRLAQEVRARMGQLESEVEQRTVALQKTSEALRESEERYKLLFRENPLPMWVSDLKTLAILAVNEASVQNYGYSEEGLLALKLKDLHCPEDWPALLERFSDENAQRSFNSLLSRHRKKDGSIIHVEICSRVIRFGGRDATLSLAQDITERQKMEAQLLRAHRVESICTLATGMAHELNNIMTPILMSAGSLRWGLKPEERESAIDSIETSVKRAVDIIKQVLTFSRGMSGERVAVHLGKVLLEMAPTLRKTLPKNIVVSSQVEDNLWTVQGERTQIFQVLQNLLNNARDAMPNGGKLEVQARNFVLKESRPALPASAPPGSYVLLQIADTGCGIAPQNRDKIFDPFFTTKPVGQGTGLGLSVVLGIVKSHLGAIMVESELRVGTVIRVLLPASPEAIKMANPNLPKGLPRGDIL